MFSYFLPVHMSYSPYHNSIHRANSFTIIKDLCSFQQFFPTRDRQWYAVIKEVQERNQAADTAHMKSSLELSEKLQAAELSMLHGIPVSQSEK